MVYTVHSDSVQNAGIAMGFLYTITEPASRQKENPNCKFFGLPGDAPRP